MYWGGGGGGGGGGEFDRHNSVNKNNSKIMENDSKSSVLYSDTADVAPIDGQMNFCGDGQLNKFVSNSITTNVEVSASVPQVQLCDGNYSLVNSSVCLNMSTHIAPQHSLPPGPWPVAHVETAHCALPHFDNALLSHHNNANVLYNLDSCNLDTKWQDTANSDLNYPDKDRGYIALQPTDFRFIGPDRLGIDTSNLDLYLKVAGTVRQSGLPNYRQVRIPINSGLNIQAWQHHLSDYGDQLLVQYLQYGFPLSIRDPDMLVMRNVKNHYSALQYHESVASYLTREKALGAIMALF